MNILVCIKQVPNVSEMRLDPQTGMLIRTGVSTATNPFDLYALEAAARMRDVYPEARIIVASMGPPQAESSLRECLAIAADSAYLISDAAFAGADTYATAYTLSLAVRYIEKVTGRIDAIFCGKQAIDGDTAQVGPILAERLGLAQITSALSIEADSEAITALQECGSYRRVLRAAYPCLVTFTKPQYDCRAATARRKLASRRVEIGRIDSSMLPGFERGKTGLLGSPTQMKNTFSVAGRGGGRIVSGVSAEAAAEELYKAVAELGLVSAGEVAK